ncbi:pentatricopeptide repeat-containing protein At3g09040, mitochondrial [Selaginella moellendorffii]|nr:pentatricopeptide repeat-containing protein At3g09040, mitochondrial [Selaginella moellendorffii]|eukprot:XP_024543541.1 pentatricopeptide repeat-containing protein At3g09040, mitochondrial [Selaginella moellendorffii]
MFCHAPSGLLVTADLEDHLRISSPTTGSKDWYASRLRSCHGLDEGRSIHASIRSSGHGGSRFLGNLLVQMYGKHGNFDLALETFSHIQEPNVFSWTILIAAFARNGHYHRAFELLCRMQNEGVTFNAVTISSVLTACRDIKQARELERLAAVAGFGGEERILRSLIHAYGECGSVDDAREVFDAMEAAGDLVSCTALMGAYARNGYSVEALRLFQKMSLEGVKLDKISFVSVINACACARDLRRGKLCHELLRQSGLDTDLTLQNTLLSMYGKCGMLNELHEMFCIIEAPDAVSYNSIISALAHNSQPRQALFFFRCMLLDGSLPSLVTFISVAHACGCIGDSRPAAVICSLIRDCCGVTTSDSVLRSAIVAMHGRCGDVEAAREAYESYAKDELGCTSMFAAYVQNHKFGRALGLFRRMQLEGIKPNKVTFLSALDACSNTGDASQAKTVHGCVVDAGYETDHEIGNARISMYGKCGSLEQARKLFDMKTYKDVLTWTGMAGAYARNKEETQGLKLFKEMQLNGIKPNKVAFVVALDACANSGSSFVLSQGRRLHEQVSESGLERDTAVGNCLINMYVSCGSLKDARTQLEKMENQKNLTSWNTMVCGLARSSGHEEQALDLISLMDLEGVAPDVITFSSALEACASTAALARGQMIHARIVESGDALDLHTNLVLGTCLVNLYGKCGSPGRARQVFEEIRSSGDTVLWNAMIGAYTRHGRVGEAVELFQALVVEGVAPDKVTFVSILAGFCHGCHQQEEAAAAEHFLLMNEFMVKPGAEHFTCLIDLLARKGRLLEAEELLKAMPFQPQGINLVSLLAACKRYQEVERAESTAEFIMKLDPTQAPAYVLLSDVYAAAA